MAHTVFSYPLTSPTISFAAIRDPHMGGFGFETQWKSPAIRSGGGNLFVYDKDVTKNLVPLVWKNADPTDIVNCMAFLRAINFTANPFRFVDPAGNPHEAQFWGPSKLIWTPGEYSNRDFAIQLLVWALPA